MGPNPTFPVFILIYSTTTCLLSSGPAWGDGLFSSSPLHGARVQPEYSRQNSLAAFTAEGFPSF